MVDNQRAGVQTAARLLPPGQRWSGGRVYLPGARRNRPCKVCCWWAGTRSCYETWGNGHNDAAMLFFILLAAWWMLRRHYTLANLALVAGALKFIPALLISAAAVVLAWRNLAGRRERAGFILKTALGGLLMMVIFYFPFWYGPATFRGWPANGVVHHFPAGSNPPDAAAGTGSGGRRKSSAWARLGSWRSSSWLIRARAGCRTGFSLGCVLHPGFLFAGGVPVVPAMVQPVAGSPGSAAPGRRKAPGYPFRPMGTNQAVPSFVPDQSGDAVQIRKASGWKRPWLRVYWVCPGWLPCCISVHPCQERRPGMLPKKPNALIVKSQAPPGADQDRLSPRSAWNRPAHCTNASCRTPWSRCARSMRHG